MTIAELNKLEKENTIAFLKACCGSTKWLTTVMYSMPFNNERHLAEVAEAAWYEQCKENDWLEAFLCHPKIGDVKSLTEKFASTAHLAGNEQESVNTASAEVINELAESNSVYEKKNGFIFIVSATGKSASEMLRLLNDRLLNSKEEEIRIAMGEQHKITLLRFRKSIEGDWSGLPVSQITTHVLDTAIGKPAAGISILLKSNDGKIIAQGVTNADGRIPDLLPPGRLLPVNTYKMVFKTDHYFTSSGTKSFYPLAEISFNLFDKSHYHIPLLLSPFGYSTYRGS